MMQLEAFLATLRAQPQPNRTIVDGLPASVAGYAGSPSSGAALFSGGAINGSSASCTQCHVRANGSGTTVVSASALGDSQGFKPAQLTDLYRQTGFSKSSLANDRGFGYGHDGSFDSVFNLLASHVTNFPAGQSGVDMRRDLEAFLMCFPSGTHPAVGAQATFDGTNNSAPGLVGLLSTMLSLADSGAVGVVAKGVVGGLPRVFADQVRFELLDRRLHLPELLHAGDERKHDLDPAEGRGAAAHGALPRGRHLRGDGAPRAWLSAAAA
jgi:hypothetical protein